METPVPGLVLTFVPYDRDSVLRALEAKAGPRPHTKELDSLFRAFREPFLAHLRVSADIDRLKAEESRLGRQGTSEGSPDPRLAAIRDSLAILAARSAETAPALDRARDTLWPRIDSLRRDVNRWEETAYRGYDAVVRRLRERAGVNAVADTTDFGGWGTIRIPPGRWWVTTRTIDPTDPNAEWYWNLPVEGDTVRLDPRTGTVRPRY